MQLLQLKEIGEFEKLEKGEVLIIKWHECARDGRNKPLNQVMATKVREVKPRCQEIVLSEPHNVFFNYRMCVDGISKALEVYRVVA